MQQRQMLLKYQYTRNIYEIFFQFETIPNASKPKPNICKTKNCKLLLFNQFFSTLYRLTSFQINNTMIHCVKLHATSMPFYQLKTNRKFSENRNLKFIFV